MIDLVYKKLTIEVTSVTSFYYTFNKTFMYSDYKIFYMLRHIDIYNANKNI